MIESQSLQEPQTQLKAARFTPRRLGVALLALLAVGTVSLSVVQARSGRLTAAGTGFAPGPLALAAPPQLPAPPPAVLTRGEGSAVGFAATLDRTAIVKQGDGIVRMELVMKADQVPGRPRVDSDLVVVLDRSGSMSGGNIEQARAAVSALLKQLSPGDRFGLVVYDDSAQVLIPLSHPQPGAIASWERIVASIEPGSSTNMSDGLDQGLALLQGARMAGRAGRVLLLSDGHANGGDASPEGLRARGKRATQNELVLSTIGIGLGFNEFLMSQIADAGTGNFHYLNESQNLATIFERELSSTRSTVASSLRVRITPAPGVEVLDAAGYPLETGGGATAFQVGSLFSGQERRVWVTLRVPADQQGERALGNVTLSYTEAGKTQGISVGAKLAVRCVENESDALAAIDKAAWERSVAQEEWGRVQQDVARAVHEGQREQAVAALDDYHQKYAPLNGKLGSAAVSGSLKESQALKRQVDDAFQGADQAGKQNVFSKNNWASARGKRRMDSSAAF